MHSWARKADEHFPKVAGAHRAFDLLDIPNKDYRAAFYFALRNLLIAKDSRDAVRINQGRSKFRIVTMQVCRGFWWRVRFLGRLLSGGRCYAVAALHCRTGG